MSDSIAPALAVGNGDILLLQNESFFSVKGIRHRAAPDFQPLAGGDNRVGKKGSSALGERGNHRGKEAKGGDREKAQP
jgi:hypothetical protein